MNIMSNLDILLLQVAAKVAKTKNAGDKLSMLTTLDEVMHSIPLSEEDTVELHKFYETEMRDGKFRKLNERYVGARTHHYISPDGVNVSIKYPPEEGWDERYDGYVMNSFTPMVCVTYDPVLNEYCRLQTLKANRKD